MEEEKIRNPMVEMFVMTAIGAEVLKAAVNMSDQEPVVEGNDGPETCPECAAGRRLCVKNGFVYRKTKVKADGTGVGARVQRYRCTKCGHIFTIREEIVDA
jgi:transposase